MEPLRPNSPAGSPPLSPRQTEDIVGQGVVVERVERVDRVAHEALEEVGTGPGSPASEWVSQAILQGEEFSRRERLEAYADMQAGIEKFDPASPSAVAEILPLFHTSYRGELSLLLLEVILNKKWTDPSDSRLIALHQLKQKNPQGVSLLAKTLWQHPEFTFELYGEIISKVSLFLNQEHFPRAVFHFFLCGLRWDDMPTPDLAALIDEFFRLIYTKHAREYGLDQKKNENPNSSASRSRIWNSRPACQKIIGSAERLQANGGVPYNFNYAGVVACCLMSAQQLQSSKLPQWLLQPFVKDEPDFVFKILIRSQFAGASFAVVACATCNIATIFEHISSSQPICPEIGQIVFERLFAHGNPLLNEKNGIVLFENLVIRLANHDVHCLTSQQLALLLQWFSKAPPDQQRALLLKIGRSPNLPLFWTAYTPDAETLLPETPQMRFFERMVVLWPQLRLPKQIKSPTLEIFQAATLMEQAIYACQFPRNFATPLLNLEQILSVMNPSENSDSYLWLLHQQRYNGAVASFLRKNFISFVEILSVLEVESCIGDELARLNQGLRILAALLKEDSSFTDDEILIFRSLLLTITTAALHRSLHEARELVLNLGEIARKAPDLFVSSSNVEERNRLELTRALDNALHGCLDGDQTINLSAAVYHLYHANPELFRNEKTLKSLVSRLPSTKALFFKKAFYLMPKKGQIIHPSTVSKPEIKQEDN